MRSFAHAASDPPKPKPRLMLIDLSARIARVDQNWWFGNYRATEPPVSDTSRRQPAGPISTLLVSLRRRAMAQPTLIDLVKVRNGDPTMLKRGNGAR